MDYSHGPSQYWSSYEKVNTTSTGYFYISNGMVLWLMLLGCFFTRTSSRNNKYMNIKIKRKGSKHVPSYACKKERAGVASKDESKHIIIQNRKLGISKVSLERNDDLSQNRFSSPRFAWRRPKKVPESQRLICCCLLLLIQCTLHSDFEQYVKRSHYSDKNQ